MQVKSFFEVMMRPMPPDMSQLSVPTFVRLACADAGIGSATAAATAKTAIAPKGLSMCNSLSQCMSGCKRYREQQVPCPSGDDVRQGKDPYIWTVCPSTKRGTRDRSKPGPAQPAVLADGQSLSGPAIGPICGCDQRFGAPISAPQSTAAQRHQNRAE